MSDDKTTQRIDTGGGDDVAGNMPIGGDHVGRDQIGGDVITVGNVTGSVLAVGRGAQANVQQDTADLDRLFQPLVAAI